MSSSLEVWGGVEYTLNRVRDRYLDQTRFSGHDQRLSDYDLFPVLGITTVRTGLLWERFERDGNWRWADANLKAIREAGLRPIAGLLHHGSGPKHTSLLDPEFPEKLAAYAARVAARYPWIDAYTPINEPNTTARFSCLYGLWYPHHKSRGSFLCALLREVKATVLSMRAIRQVRPDAQLLQTDDAGRVYSTPELAATCDLLNERRWLQIDLLCGRVDQQHPLFTYIRDSGIPEAEILWFRDNPCPPSIVGLNYYVTSDRFLDHRLALHPGVRVCEEGPFLDLEAVRARKEGITGYESLLLEADARFGLPTAISEVHLGDSAEGQIRWTVEAWRGAQRARAAGANCFAITFWALLGSFYWSTLVTRKRKRHGYEPGVFELRDGEVLPTELGAVIAQLARGEEPTHAALAQPGWWQQDERLHRSIANGSM